jgi:hypothetical protein
MNLSERRDAWRARLEWLIRKGIPASSFAVRKTEEMIADLDTAIRKAEGE